MMDSGAAPQDTFLSRKLHPTVATGPAPGHLCVGLCPIGFGNKKGCPLSLAARKPDLERVGHGPPSLAWHPRPRSKHLCLPRALVTSALCLQEFQALCTRNKLLAEFGDRLVRLSTANTYSYRKGAGLGSRAHALSCTLTGLAVWWEAAPDRRGGQRRVRNTTLLGLSQCLPSCCHGWLMTEDLA